MAAEVEAAAEVVVPVPEAVCRSADALEEAEQLGATRSGERPVVAERVASSPVEMVEEGEC